MIFFFVIGLIGGFILKYDYEKLIIFYSILTLFFLINYVLNNNKNRGEMCNKLSKNKCHLKCIWLNDKCVKNKYYNLPNMQFKYKSDKNNYRTVDYEKEYLKAKNMEFISLDKSDVPIPGTEIKFYGIKDNKYKKIIDDL